MGWLQFFSPPTAAQLARRKRDELRRLSTKPSTGTTIFCADLRMSVQAGMSLELWRFLASRGWRELDDPSLRLRLRALPSTAVMALIDGPAERWEELLAKAMKLAVQNAEPVRVAA